MTTTLDQTYDAARQLPLEEQEVVGRLMQAALMGETVTLAEVEEHYRDEHTRQGLAEAERGEGITVAEARSRMDQHLKTIR